MRKTDAREPGQRALWIEALITLLVGGGTWLISQRFIEYRHSEAEATAVVLSFLVGGMVFLVQELTRFDRRVWRLEREQARRLARVEVSSENAREVQARHERSVRDMLDDHFAKVSRASNLYALMEGSPFGSEIFEELGQYASSVGPETPYLLRDLISQELCRLSETVRQIGGNQGVWYEGEDREWLLALAMSARVSIDAVSLPVADGSSHGFDDGFWMRDFGERYLEEQYNSIVRRGVRVRRIFVYDQPSPDGALLAIQQRQMVKQVDVRVLRWWAIPQEHHEDVSDFIIFDGRLLYELSPAQVGLRPKIDASGHLARATRLRTHLDVDHHTLDTKRGLFEFLWGLGGEVNRVGDVDVLDLIRHPDDGCERSRGTSPDNVPAQGPVLPGSGSAPSSGPQPPGQESE